MIKAIEVKIAKEVKIDKEVKLLKKWKGVIACDVSPVAMFYYYIPTFRTRIH